MEKKSNPVSTDIPIIGTKRAVLPLIRLVAYETNTIVDYEIQLTDAGYRYHQIEFILVGAGLGS
jgi:hypothetical protein